LKKNKSGAGCFLLVVVCTIIILSGAWFFTGWRSSRRVLPRGLTIAGLPMSGMTREQAINALIEAYAAPLTVYYLDKPILLVPEMIELTLDVEATNANLDEVLEARSRPEGFLQYVLEQVTRSEPPPQDVHPILSYSRERLDAFLARTAQQYDHSPLDPVPLPAAGTFRPPQPGTTLDQAASLPLLVKALLSPTTHEVGLVVDVTSVKATPPDILRQALDKCLADFTGVASIFVKDLDTGRELCYNCNVAFSGMSTLKIGIVLDLYRELDTPPDPQLTSLISATLTQSDNAAANLILAEIGAGNPYTGALQVTDFLHSLGLQNTFMAAPYDLKDGVEQPDIVTPANSRTDINTEPDPYIQTTPLEIGLLLEALDQCAERNSGMLQILYPREITQAECQDLLTWMKHNEVNTLLQQGMPPGTEGAHKQGWTGNTHADIALIYSPGGRFVISAFLYQPEWLVWEESAPLFAEVGQLTYRFFNPGQ